MGDYSSVRAKAGRNYKDFWTDMVRYGFWTATVSNDKRFTKVSYFLSFLQEIEAERMITLASLYLSSLEISKASDCQLFNKGRYLYS